MTIGKLKAKSIIFKMYLKEPLSKVKFEKTILFEDVTLNEAISRLHHMFNNMIWEIKGIWIDGYKIAQLPISNQHLRNAKLRRKRDE